MTDSHEGFIDQLKFIECLRQQVRGGAGLVPFIGSGCSADSGILMGKQFTDYLAYTVWRCLKEGVWDLRESGWPPVPNQRETRDARRWVLEEFRKVAEDCGLDVFSNNSEDRVTGVRRKSATDSLRQLQEPLVPPFLRARGMTEPEMGAARQLLALLPKETREAMRGGMPRPNRSPTSDEALVERGIRSLYDWRATLQFLSELRVETHPVRRSALAEPDSSVIDSFNVRITRGRRPNPVHYMLSHLREPARMRVILTTNFDTMIEDAFQAHHKRIEVVPVSIRGSLPHPDLVHSRDTLVKLHGGLIETRADFSLDCDPDLEERRKFFHYVRGRYPGDYEPGFLPSQLLVAGYSGSDARCMQLLKFVLDSDPNARIFWVCHSRHEVPFVNQLFSRAEYGDRVLVTVAARFDLLLLELYQRIRLHLPPGGDNFPLNHEVPPIFSDTQLAPLPAAETIVARVRAKALKEGKGGVFSVEGRSGVLPALRDAADVLTGEDALSAIWLELEDCRSTAAVAHHLFQAIANRRGLFQLSHALLCPKGFFSSEDGSADEQVDAEDWLSHLRPLVRHMGIEPSRWLIVLYGRNGPGGCAGWNDGDFWKRPEYDRLNEFLRALGALQFVVLYAPYSSERLEKDEERKGVLVKLIKRRLPAESVGTDLDRLVADEFKLPDAPHDNPPGEKIQLNDVLSPSRQELNFKNVMDAVLSEEVVRGGCDDRTIRNQHNFLFGLALFRQSRPYSALLAEGILSCPSRFNVVGDDNDYRRSAELEEVWLAKYLQAPRVFLRKSGGFLWLYRDVRQGIRVLVLAAESSQLAGDRAATGIWPRDETASRAHHHIAEWYERAFLVSGHAGTLTEAAFHFYSCAAKAKNYTASAALTDRGAQRWLVGVCELIRLLRIGRASVRFWMEHAHRLDWFGKPSIDRVCEKLAEAADGIEFDEPELHQRWCSLTRRLLEMLRCELDWLGATAQPAARIASPLSLLGPELASHYQDSDSKNNPAGQRDIPDRFCASVIEALDAEQPHGPKDEWWKSPKVGLPETAASVDLLNRLNAPAAKEPKDVLREWRQHWFREYLKQPIRASFWVQELVEVAYICLRRATMDERLSALDHAVDVHLRRKLRNDHGQKWIAVCALANAATQAATWNTPGQDEFVMRMRSKAEAIYGLALAHLHRFYEAHRRLNHAHALAIRSGGGGLQVMLGIIELRRAEAYLIEAEVVTEIHADLAAGIKLDESDRQLAKQLDVSQRPTNRCAALRDDAWCASERAEGLLAGRTHGSGWWVRLRTLQLWAISMSAKDPKTRSLTDRVRHDSAHVVDHLLDEGLAAFPDDWHNRLRLLDYYLHAGLALVDAKLASKQSIANKVREALGDGKPRPKWEAKLLSQRTKNYAEKIRARLKPLLTPSSSAVPGSAAAAE